MRQQSRELPMNIKIQSLAGALALAALSLPLTAQASFQSLGTPGGFIDVQDMSADGTAMVATANGQAYLWTTSSPSFTPIPGTNGIYSSYSVSNGGQYVCATIPDGNGDDVAARWSQATGLWTLLPGLGGQSGTSIGSAYDISADGSVVVGLGWITPNIAHGFRWDPVGGMVDLGTFAPGLLSSSRADGVSADGTTITGFDSDPVTGVWRGVVWTNLVETQTGSLDPADPIDGPSQGFAVSADGTYVVGESSTGLYTPSNWNEMHAFRSVAVNGLLDLGIGSGRSSGWGNHSTIPAASAPTDARWWACRASRAFGPGAVRRCSSGTRATR
jgi:probable HAF family extracellular repeat protein